MGTRKCSTLLSVRVISAASTSGAMAASSGWSARAGPRRQVEPALGGARRARVEADHLARRRTVQEERQPDRDVEHVPLGGRIGRAGSHGVPVGHRAVPAPAGLAVREQQIARAAGAQQAGLLQVRHVTVLGRDLGRAQLALLLGLRAAAAASGRPRRRPRRGPRPGCAAGARWPRGGSAGRVGHEPAQARGPAHDGTAAGTATRTPWLSVSSGSGSRCGGQAVEARARPATSYRLPQGQVSTSRSSVPSASDEPQDAHPSR